VFFDTKAGDNKIFATIGGFILGTSTTATNYTLRSSVTTSLESRITRHAKLFIMESTFLRIRDTISVDGALILCGGAIKSTSDYTDEGGVEIAGTLKTDFLVLVSSTGTLVMVGSNYNERLVDVKLSVVGGRIFTDGFVVRNVSLELTNLATMDIINNQNPYICQMNGTSGLWTIKNSQATFREFNSATDGWIPLTNLTKIFLPSVWTVNCIKTSLETSALLRIKDSIAVVWNSTLELLDKSAEMRIEDTSTVTFQSDTIVDGLITADVEASIYVNSLASFRY
jgi:hypothetical protein